MWEEYADGSKGVCFEFDTEQADKTASPFSTKNCNMCYPMIYADKKVDLSEFVLGGDIPDWSNTDYGTDILDYLIILITMLKSSEYKHENE